MEIEKAIFYSNYKEMKAEMGKYEKLTAIKDEDFTKEQEYMKEKAIEKARSAYRIRTKMVQRVKMNFKNMHKENLGCEYCEAEFETQEHVMVCEKWEEQRRGLDLYRMSDMVSGHLLQQRLEGENKLGRHNRAAVQEFPVEKQLRFCQSIYVMTGLCTKYR